MLESAIFELHWEPVSAMALGKKDFSSEGERSHACKNRLLQSASCKQNNQDPRHSPNAGPNMRDSVILDSRFYSSLA